MTEVIGKMSKRQKVFSWLCIQLAGDKYEERASNLLPERYRIKGLRLKLYKIVSHWRYVEGERLVKKYGTHQFE